MKKFLHIINILLLLGGAICVVSSCKTGYGCQAEEEYKKKQEKPLSSKRGKSKLFKG